MKIVSYNINGIRASQKLGLLNWIKSYSPDVFCVQEVRANETIARQIIEGKNQLSLMELNTDFNLTNTYFAIYNCGTVPGYAGTLILTKIKPSVVFYDMGEFWKDSEGRTTTVVINNVAIINAYIPNGNSRLEFKMKYLEALTKYINKLKQTYSVVCVGDFNIAHNEIDLTNPKECKNKSVFLPMEREAFNKILNVGLIDSFRFLNPTTVKYTWRSYRSIVDSSYNAWKYRIDYILISKNLEKNLMDAQILDENYSDHLPIMIDLNI